MPEQQPTLFKHWGPLMVLLLGLLIVVIDSSLLNVSLAAIIRDLHTSITKLQWVISAYSLTLGALLITGGRLGDLYGRKKLFMIGAVIFAIGSYIASVSHSFTELLVGESIIEGLGAAMMTPATSSLLIAHYKGRDRSIAYGFWGAAAALGIAIGPLLGGYLATYYSWRWGFRINLVVAALLLLGAQIITTDRPIKERGNFDWVGVILSAIGMLLLMFGIIESSTYGWILEKAPLTIGTQSFSIAPLSITPLFILAGVLFLGLFMMFETKREKLGLPLLVSFHLFENKQFRAGTIAYGLFALTQVSIMFTLAVFFQTVVGLDSLHTGYVYLPLSLSLVVAAPAAGYLAGYISPKRLIQIGFIIQIVEAVIIHFQLNAHTTINNIVPAIILSGIGLGFLSSQVANLTLSSVNLSEAGEASGINQSFRQIGGSLGTAVIGAIIITIANGHLQSLVTKNHAIDSTSKYVINRTISAQADNLEFDSIRLPADQLKPATIAQASEFVESKRKDAIVQGNKDAFIFIALFALLGLIVSSWLPNQKIKH